MPLEEKEQVSPEVYQLDWLPLGEAVGIMLGSMKMKGDFLPVNAWQEEQFHMNGVKVRATHPGSHAQQAPTPSP